MSTPSTYTSSYNVNVLHVNSVLYSVVFVLQYIYLHKYNERRAMASKVKYRNEEERMIVIKPEVMSSAESGEDDGEEVIIVRPLPWLSAEVTAFKQQLDEEIKREKSPQARRQMKRRVIGSPSARPTPADE